MRYYDNKSDKCIVCPLALKYNNVSTNYSIVEAESPTEYVIKTCGGIDLIITDSKNKTYLTEVKPKNSKETIVRMIAEIYTYTIGFEGEKEIAFFEGSQQEKDYKKYYNNKYFRKIIDKVTVFKFVEKEGANGIVNFEIVKL